MAENKTAKQVINSLKSNLKSKIKGRPKPSAPRAGFLPSGRRYGCGGKVSK